MKLFIVGTQRRDSGYDCTAQRLLGWKMSVNEEQTISQYYEKSIYFTTMQKAVPRLRTVRVKINSNLKLSFRKKN